MTKKKSIVLVAEHAGCSIATVSNVLNHKGRVGATTRENVLRAVKNLKYQPNSMGRNLRLQRTETIGLLFYPSCVEIFRNPFYAEVVEGIEKTLQMEGYDLLLSSYAASNPLSKVPDLLSRGKVDGIILLGAFPFKILHTICKQKAPLVLIDSNADLPVDTIGTDGFSAEMNIVKYLHSLGHCRILFLGYKHEEHNIDFREQGFLEGLKQAGLKGGKKNVIREFQEHDDIYIALRKRMTSGMPPTAAVAVNDSLATGMLSRLTADGIKVPEQFSIVGFDDYATSSHTSPPLATVRVDKEKLSQIGVKMLIKRIKEPDLPVAKHLLLAEFIVRDSVGKISG